LLASKITAGFEVMSTYVHFQMSLQQYSVQLRGTTMSFQGK